MSVRSLCNTTATVYQTTKTSDAIGGWTESRSARFTSMPCRIQAISGNEQMVYAAQRMVATHKLYAPGDYTGIDSEDEIVDAGSVRYRVKFIRDPDQLGHHVEVTMEQLKGDIQ